MKKILALVLAALMLIGMMSVAFADDPAPATPVNADPAPATPVNNVTLDKTISVSNLDKDDSVTFYQIIKWVDGTGWAWNDGFEAAASTAEVTLPALETITGKLDTTTKEFTPGVISVENAAILAKAAVKMSGNAGTKTADATPGTVTLGSDTEPVATGLYFALVTPASADTLYNPIFVAADFSQKDSSPNSQAATLDKSYSPAAVAKKETVTLTKEVDGTADTKYDVNVGDVIPFTITSKVPAFTGAYIDPVYEITDIWEAGLAAPTDLVVKVGEKTLEAGETKDYIYTLDETNRQFTVKLNKTELDRVAGIGLAQDITITYKSKITELDEGHVTVTEKTNEATVKFSNKPTDKDSYSLMEDKTRNYTFSLDANLLGTTGKSYETDELIKIGLDEKGQPLTEKRNYRSGTTWKEYSPLQGAEFTLYKEDGTTVYTNDVFNGTKIISDETGRLLIEGLDAGVYKLKETKAPAGFIKDDRTFTITITAEYDEIQGGVYNKTVDGKTVPVKYDAYKVLKSYKVVVNDGTNDVESSYTISKKGEVDHQVVDRATFKEVTGSTDQFAGDSITPICNTKGTELPSTGGIGTTILYIGGSILVILAAVLLVTKRRMNANND